MIRLDGAFVILSQSHEDNFVDGYPHFQPEYVLSGPTNWTPLFPSNDKREWHWWLLGSDSVSFRLTQRAFSWSIIKHHVYFIAALIDFGPNAAPFPFFAEDYLCTYESAIIVSLQCSKITKSFVTRLRRVRYYFGFGRSWQLWTIIEKRNS
jgi:hypothetical protein